MLYAPRGVGKTLLALSMGLAVASGSPFLRWHAPRQRRVLYVDGEMPLVSLQERLRAISTGLGAVIPNDGFRRTAVAPAKYSTVYLPCFDETIRNDGRLMSTRLHLKYCDLRAESWQNTE